MRLLLSWVVLAVTLATVQAEAPNVPTLNDDLKTLREAEWQRPGPKDKERLVLKFFAGDKKALFNVAVYTREGKEETPRSWGGEMLLQEEKGTRFILYGEPAHRLEYQFREGKLILKGRYVNKGSAVDLDLSGPWEKVAKPKDK